MSLFCSEMSIQNENEKKPIEFSSKNLFFLKKRTYFLRKWIYFLAKKKYTLFYLMTYKSNKKGHNFFYFLYSHSILIWWLNYWLD